MNSSNYVKKWRTETKKRMVMAMGGKCQICGYNRCNNALEFHHIDPKEKDFAFGKALANPKKWNTVVEELRKCVLLCANCHREVHDNAVSLPINFQNFDESYARYTAKTQERAFDKCPICDNDKPIIRLTCSRACAAKKSRTVDWDNINVNDLLNKYGSYEAVGRVLGLSGSAVKKHYKKFYC